MPAPSRRTRTEAPSTRRTAQVRPQKSRRQRWVFIGIGVAGVALLTTALAWGPVSRSRALNALDACREGARTDEALRLADVFASDWGAESGYVREAIRDGRGPVEAQVLLARLGKHRDLLAGLAERPQLTPAQRALACNALAELWPTSGDGPRLPTNLAEWAADPQGDAGLGTAAVRLLLASRNTDAAECFSRMAGNPKLDRDRAIGAAEALAAIVQREGGEHLLRLLGTLAGPHRAGILASQAVRDVVREQASPSYAEKLLSMLAEPDLQGLALAALGGPKMNLPNETSGRVAFAGKLAPYLNAGSNAAVLTGALSACRRHRLVEAHAPLLALLPSLAQKPPAGTEIDWLAEMYGSALVNRSTPETSAATEILVAGLIAGLADDSARPLAAAALARVTDTGVEALRGALDPLAARADDKPCRAALEAIVVKAYGRDDIAKAAGGTAAGWKAAVERDKSRRNRITAIRTWMSDHRNDIRIEAGRERLTPAKAELGKFRDEVGAWLNSSDPPPIGHTKGHLQDLANEINMMLGMVNKAWAGAM